MSKSNYICTIALGSQFLIKKIRRAKYLIRDMFVVNCFSLELDSHYEMNLHVDIGGTHISCVMTVERQFRDRNGIRREQARNLSQVQNSPR